MVMNTPGNPMTIIDLSHIIFPDMPVYPGTEQPVLKTGCSIEEDGFLEKEITFYSHTGTHIDAPAHLIKDAKTLDQLSIDHFHGTALLLNVEDHSHCTIDIIDLEPFVEQFRESDFLLFHTGWSKHWGSVKYFRNYPVLSTEAAAWLAPFNFKGIGFDTISADIADSQDFPVHNGILQKGTIIIENLTNLSQIPDKQFTFSCFPLYFENADGSPVRAVAHLLG